MLTLFKEETQEETEEEAPVNTLGSLFFLSLSLLLF